jgi:hypothetical protein
MKRAIYWTFSFAILLAAVGGLMRHTWHGAATGPAGKTALSDELPPAFTPATGQSLYVWKIRDEALYRFKVSLALAPSAAANPTPVLVMEGEFALRVSSISGEQILLAGRVLSAQAQRQGEQCPRTADFLKTVPVRLAVTPGGEIQEMACAADIPEADRELLRMVFCWELVGRDAPAYETVEKTGDVEFSAQYVQARKGILKKTRSLHGSQGGDQKILLSGFHGEIQGQPWFRSFAGEESSLALMNGKEFFRSTVTVELQRISSMLPSKAGILLPDAASLARFTATAVQADTGLGLAAFLRRKDLERRFASSSWSMLHAELEAAAEKDISLVSGPLERLVGWLQLHPESCADVVASLQRPESTPNLSGLLVHALVAAGHSKALQSLAGVIDRSDEFPPQVGLQAVVAAGTAEIPDPALISSLWNTLSDPQAGESVDETGQDAVLFALGSLSAMEPDLRDKLAKILEPRLDEAQFSGEDVRTAILSAANGKMSSLEDSIRRIAASSTNPSLRSAASDYLSRMGDRDSLVEMLQRESDEEVQLAVLEHLGDPSEGGLRTAERPAVSLQSTVAKSAQVRAKAAGILSLAKP